MTLPLGSDLPPVSFAARHGGRVICTCWLTALPLLAQPVTERPEGAVIVRSPLPAAFNPNGTIPVWSMAEGRNFALTTRISF